MIEENITGIPSKIKTGDLLLRKINATGPYHIGVYCGKCVIEYTGNHFFFINFEIRYHVRMGIKNEHGVEISFS